MTDISFSKSKDGYVAEFDAPGNILLQIHGVKRGRLSMYHYIQGMSPSLIDTQTFENEIIQLTLVKGLKVRLESDVEVKACKYITMPSQTAGSGAGEGEAYELPQASASTLGGVKLGFAQVEKKYPLVADENGKAYIEVPWEDTNTTYDKASDSVLGLVKIGYSQNAKKYPVQLDADGKAYVEVPWEDTNTTYNKASDSVLGLVKIGYSQNAKKYPVQLDVDGKAYVEVPWSDENTEYSAATPQTLGLVKQAAFVTDATGQEDAHTTINSIKQSLIAAGIMAGS